MAKTLTKKRRQKKAKPNPKSVVKKDPKAPKAPPVSVAAIAMESTRRATPAKDSDANAATATAKPRRCPYDATIREALARIGLVGAFDPRHIEAYMRTGHSTLDGLSRSEFDAEVELCVGCIIEGGVDEAEDAARSHGL